MDPPNTSTELGGYFPLDAIRSLLWRDDHLEGINIQSKEPGDTAKVYIIPLPIGLYLQALDSKESIFHIECYPLHAEIWLAFEWLESNTRRTRRKSDLAVERATRDKYKARMEELLSELPEQLGVAYNIHLAELALQEIKNSQLTHLDNVLKMLNIAHLLKRYQDEDQTK